MNEKLNNNTRINCDDDIVDFIASEMLSPDANMQLADPGLVSFYKDYNARCVWIDKDISCSLFQEARQIIQWNRQDKDIPVEERTPIKILIHSYGGDLEAMMSFMDLIAISKTPIWTVNMGQALSCGALLLLNGHKGNRYCLKSSQALIHNGSASMGGSFNAVQAQSENYKKEINLVHNNILEHTNIDAKTLKKWDNKEIYLFADEQLSYGLVDHIVEDITEIL